MKNENTKKYHIASRKNQPYRIASRGIDYEQLEREINNESEYIGFNSRTDEELAILEAEQKLWGFSSNVNSPFADNKAQTKREYKKKDKKKDKKGHKKNGKKSKKNREGTDKIKKNESLTNSSHYNDENFFADRSPLSMDVLLSKKENILQERNFDLTAITAETLLSKNELAVAEGSLYYYDNGYYHILNKADAQVFITGNIDRKEQIRMKSYEISSVYKYLLALPELQKTLSGGIGTPYVNCMNGVFNAETGELLEHNSSYEFKHCIHASYNHNASGEHFLRFINDACFNDENKIKRVQEVLGYVFSSYVNIKKAILFYGPSNTGKSLILNVIQHIVGDENVSHVTIQQLSKETYIAKMLNKLVNISSDLPTEPIKDIGLFKSTISGLDTVEGRELYKNPVSQKCECKQLYGTNNFVPLKNVGDAESFFNRILLVSFKNIKAPEEQDSSLADKLYDESDFIFTWAMTGLMRLVNNNFIFTHCPDSESDLERYKAEYAPELCFFNKYLEVAEDEIISTEEVKEKFIIYADEVGASVSETGIYNFIKSNYPSVKKKRKRMGGKNPIAVYIGLKFK